MRKLFHIIPQLTEEELRRVKHEYVYRREGKGVLENLSDKAIELWVVPYLPMWLSPNAITLSGFTVHLAALMNLIWWSENRFLAEQPAINWWIYILSLLFYVICDSADGQQAKRTGSGSPLGELMDHGIDTFMSFLIQTSVVLHSRMLLFHTQMTTMFLVFGANFFLPQYLAKLTGIYRMRATDNVENVYGIIVLHAFVAMYSTDIIFTPLPPMLQSDWVSDLTGVKPLSYFELLRYPFVSLLGVTTVVWTTFQIRKELQKEKQSIAPVSSLVIITTQGLIIYWLVSETAIRDAPFQFILCFYNLSVAKQTWLIILAKLAVTDSPLLDSSMCIQALCIGLLLLSNWGAIGMSHVAILNVCTFLTLTDVVAFIVVNIRTVATELGIHVFSTKKPHNI